MKVVGVSSTSGNNVGIAIKNDFSVARDKASTVGPVSSNVDVVVACIKGSIGDGQGSIHIHISVQCHRSRGAIYR